MVVGELLVQADVVVLGAGEAGLAAALRAAALGREVTLVDLAGTGTPDLDVDRALALLLDTVRPVVQAARRQDRGVQVEAAVDGQAVLAWVHGQLDAEAQMWARRLEEAGVNVMAGEARFEEPTVVRVATEHGATRLDYTALVLAPEAEAEAWPGLDFDGERVLRPGELLARGRPPESLAVVAAHPWGLELATAYAALGGAVRVVIPKGEHPVAGFPSTWLEDVLADLAAQGVQVHLDVADPAQAVAQDPLVVVAGGPGLDLGGLEVERAGIELVDPGRARVNERLQTSNPQVWAAGPAAGGFSPAEARQQGRVAAEALAGRVALYTPQAVPRRLRTVPELAGAGLTPEEAQAQGYHMRVGQAQADGMAVQVVTDEHEPFVLGVFARGEGVGPLAGEAALAVEMAATLTDLAATLHPVDTAGALVQQVAAELEGEEGRLKTED